MKLLLEDHGIDMEKTDLKKTLDGYKAKHNQFRVIDVPAAQYLMVDGHGDPNTSQEFADAIQALYPLAYKIKFASKLALAKDYVVMPLEALWWSRSMAAFTSERDKSTWDWTLMIMQPDWITAEMFGDAALKVGDDISRNVRMETLDEGLSVQTLHIGSFDDEAALLAAMHSDFIPMNRLRMTKKHHEIYLSDFRKTAPARLKTILRQPVIRQ